MVNQAVENLLSTMEISRAKWAGKGLPGPTIKGALRAHASS